MAILAKWAFCRQFWGKHRADQIQRQLFLLHGCFPQIHDPIQSPWHSGGTGFAAHIFHMWSLRLGQDRRLAKVRSGNYVFWPGGPHCIAIPCNFFFFRCVCGIQEMQGQLQLLQTVKRESQQRQVKPDFLNTLRRCLCSKQCTNWVQEFPSEPHQECRWTNPSWILFVQ